MERIQNLFTQLCDELCTLERDAGTPSSLIVRVGDTTLRAIDGKPVSGLSDTVVLEHTGGRGLASRPAGERLTAAALAKRLDGRQYRNETTEQDLADAKASGLVIVYGQSDDLCEMEGTFRDEEGCYGGGTLRFGEDGFVGIPERDAEVLEAYGVLDKAMEGTATFDTVWFRDESSPAWTYDVPFPHETFRIYEDGEVYCVGFVFSLSEALGHAATIKDGGTADDER